MPNPSLEEEEEEEEEDSYFNLKKSLGKQKQVSSETKMYPKVSGLSR
jgi:hypothetical protein